MQASIDVIIVAEKKFIIGHQVFISGKAPQGPYAVIFEEDEETAYFYAYDTSKKPQSIEDTVHIYDLQHSIDKGKVSIVRIGWSLDNLKALLLINDYAHAVFDFSSKQGYCRSGFPEISSKNRNGWSHKGHYWNNETLDLFKAASSKSL